MYVILLAGVYCVRLSVCLSSRPYLAGFLLSVSISELGQQVHYVELEAGTYRVPALITVDWQIVCKNHS